MAVAGGAFCPPVMGLIADHLYMAIGFIFPMVCFAFISYFGYSELPETFNLNRTFL
jgi:FHS family L-fucose permease-like MFS transporter